MGNIRRGEIPRLRRKGGGKREGGRYLEQWSDTDRLFFVYAVLSYWVYLGEKVFRLGFGGRFMLFG